MRRLLGLGAAATLTACSGPLVGGECLDGYRQVEGKCVASDVPGGSGGSGDDGHAGSGSSSGTGLGSGSGSDSGSGGLDGGGSDATSAGGDPNPSECADGDLACGGVCVDVRTDPYHCGACGNVCASGICVDGHCEGDFAGHVVLCGIEAERSTGVAPTRRIALAAFTAVAAQRARVVLRSSAVRRLLAEVIQTNRNASRTRPPATASKAPMAPTIVVR